MAEIAAVKPNGFRVISTFAGCGGSSLGYRMAGFKVLWASEFIERARLDYEANAAPGTVVDGRDIREVDPLEVLERVGLRPGELDVLDGSPPCASFSTAGKRQRDWGAVKAYSETKQRTDDLFFEYVRFVKAMQPKVFVAENVSGLVKGVAKGYFLDILAALKGCGYRVEARLLDAQWLGVPQARARIIFQGVREDLDIVPAFPMPFPYRYSVRDALGSGLRIVGGNYAAKGMRGKSVGTEEPLPTVFAGVHGGGPHQFEIETRKVATGDVVPENVAPTLEGYAVGKEWDKLNPGGQSEKFFNLVRPRLDEPSPTVTAQGAGNPGGTAAVAHPTEKRKFAIAELKRICAFPDDFALGGSYAQQWERLGRAVPPLMMRAIAETIRDRVLAPARTAVRPRRSPVRSTTGSARKGAARAR